MRHIDEIIIHCSATHPMWMRESTIAEKVNEIARWHTDPKPLGNGWRAIGYHWIISRRGEVVAGRPEGAIGAHVKGRNATSIGICLLGAHGADAYDQFEDHFTAEQQKSLLKLIEELQVRYGTLKISGHNAYANKGCPGFQVGEWLDGKVPIDTPHSAPTENTPASGGFFNALLKLIRSLFK